MESNSRSVIDMDDQDRVIHVKEVSVDCIKIRPTSSDLELVFKDDAGVTHKSYKFKNGAFVHWDLDIYVRTYTSATLTIRRVPFEIKIAEFSVEFKPYKFGDDKVVRLEDSNHRVTVTFVYRQSKCVGIWLFSGAREPSNSSYSWQTSLAFLTLRPPSQTPSLHCTPSNPVVEFQKSSFKKQMQEIWPSYKESVRQRRVHYFPGVLKGLAFPNTVAPMHAQQPGRRIRKIQFRRELRTGVVSRPQTQRAMAATHFLGEPRTGVISRLDTQ